MTKCIVAMVAIGVCPLLHYLIILEKVESNVLEDERALQKNLETEVNAAWEKPQMILSFALG